jgi:hypothetical protein
MGGLCVAFVLNVVIRGKSLAQTVKKPVTY